MGASKEGSVLFERVVIIGVGLLGGSLAMAMKRRGLVKRVAGVDIDGENLNLALELEAIDEGYTEFDDLEGDYDLVILAAPIFANEQILEAIAHKLPSEVIVTDVGSTKSQFVERAEAILDHRRSRFLGGHPMAGSEVGGVRGADPYLFENAVYLLTPTEHTDPQVLSLMQSFVQGLGAKCHLVDPNDHDAMVAAVSHVPHLVAAALVNAAAVVQKDHPQLLGLAAGGFRDTTRIAGGSPSLWRDICFSNRQHILEVLQIVQDCVAGYKEQLAAANEAEFCGSLQEAKELRSQVPAKLKGYWPLLEEVIVTIPDQPGMIGRVAAILGERAVNIDDIEILRVREGEGGTLRLGFSKEGAAVQAVKALQGRGFMCRVKP